MNNIPHSLSDSSLELAVVSPMPAPTEAKAFSPTLSDQHATLSTCLQKVQANQKRIAERPHWGINSSAEHIYQKEGNHSTATKQ